MHFADIPSRKISLLFNILEHIKIKFNSILNIITTQQPNLDCMLV